MYKKALLISIMLLTLISITLVIINNMGNNENNIISNVTKDKPVISGNMITMMYETEAGSGEYTETTDNTWPDSGYIFNENLSGCENGGELEYNSINNTVNLLSNSSDRCYVYFDKYDGVWIDNVIATNVTGNSITLDVSATSENGSISNYYYSLNDSEYVSSNTNPIVIENLNQLTEYNIKIYAIDNTGASSNIYELIITTTDISVPVINSVEVSDITTSGFTLTVNAISDLEIERYYFYINGNGENNAGTSTNNKYTFTNLNSNTSYDILVFAKNENNVYSSEYLITVKTSEILFLANYIKSLYTTQGANGLYYHTSSLANSAEDNSYRYAGANPDNYVCFGSDASTCPSDNLYRIIGVFGNQVKLIKNTSLGNYHWSGSISNQRNTWSRSTLNTGTLNGTYLSGLSSTWQNKIATTTWKVGGMSRNDSATAKQYYDTEIGSSSSSTTYSAKIGLMYVSDYGFAASPDYWTTELYNYEPSKSSNWMNISINEWTISHRWDNTGIAFMVGSTGSVGGSSYVYSASHGVRPVFYLTSTTQYVSGSGTESDPIHLKLN